MKETLKEVCELIIRTGRINKSIVAKITGILPLIRKQDSTQEELTKLRKALQANLKKLEAPEKPQGQKPDLFKDVARVLEPSMLKKKDLFAKLEEQGMRTSSSLSLLLNRWKKEDLFNTSFGQGWYCLSAKGRSAAGLPPKPSNPEETVELRKSQKELDAEKEIASLQEKLQKVEAELATARSKLGRRERKTSDVAKAARQRQLSQLDLVILGLYEARPVKLKRDDVKLLLEKKGKTPTKSSLVVLLTNSGSKEMIASSGERGDKDFSLTEIGEARGKQLFESQQTHQEKSPEPQVPSQKEEVKVESQQPQPCVEKAFEPPPIVQEGQDLYALTPEQLTDQHYDALNKVFNGKDVDRQRLYKAQNKNGNFVWTWWGLCDQFPVPPQPLLGHLLKYHIFPESLDLPFERCRFKFDGRKVPFNPLERASGRIVEFAQRNGKLPIQISA